MPDRWTEAKVATVLARRFKAPEYAFIRKVQGGTGVSRDSTRQMDAFCMALWPSRGLERQGFEIKVSRSDWLKELRQPEKVDPFLRLCHRWWIAVPEATSIVHDLELPEAWGLIEVKGGKCKIVKQAPLLQPDDLHVNFIAALLRRCVEQSVDEAALAEAREEGRVEGIEEGKRSAGGASRELETMKAQLREFKEACGLDPTGCYEIGNRDLDLPFTRNSAAHLGEAVARLLQTDSAIEGAERAYEQAESRLDTALQVLRRGRDKIES